MGREKDFDKHFRNRLFDYEENAPVHVWEQIQHGMKMQKSKRQRSIFIRIAASLALLLSFASGYYLATSESEKKPAFSVIPDKVEALNPGRIVVEPIKQASLLPVPKKENKAIRSNSEESDEAITKSVLAEITQREFAIPEKLQSKISKHIANQFVQPVLVYDGRGLQALVLPVENDEKKPDFKWLLGGSFAPGQAYHQKKPEEYSGQFEYSDVKSLNTVYSGMLQFGLQLNQRVSVHSGLAYAQLNHSSQLAIAGVTNVFNQNTSVGTILTVLPKDLVSMEDIHGTSGTDNNIVYGQFNQMLGYMELPLMAKYKIIDRKLDINLHGGFLAGYLLSNNSDFRYRDEITDLGPTSGIHKSSFTTMAGLSADYPLFGNLSVSLEPSVKYHLVQIGSNNSYKPVIFNIFTGLNFTF